MDIETPKVKYIYWKLWQDGLEVMPSLRRMCSDTCMPLSDEIASPYWWSVIRFYCSCLLRQEKNFQNNFPSRNNGSCVGQSVVSCPYILFNVCFRAGHFKSFALLGENPTSSSEGNATMPYSGFHLELTRLQAEDHIYHTG
ncbi:hypothetical protein TNCV_552911 [Trichonephila clavipes]|nr:hypothetical protein TNCV_552911 [Trichonephila clavipes]